MNSTTVHKKNSLRTYSWFILFIVRDYPASSSSSMLPVDVFKTILVCGHIILAWLHKWPVLTGNIIHYNTSQIPIIVKATAIPTSRACFCLV